MSLFGNLGAGLQKAYGDPMFQLGLGLLARPNQRFGRALGGAFSDMSQWQIQNQLLQNRMQANQVAQAEEKRRQAEALRLEQQEADRRAAMEQLQKADPRMAMYAAAAPGAIPALAASTYRKPTESPSAVREWQYFSQLPPSQREAYLQMKRAQKYGDLGSQIVPLPMIPGGPTTLPIDPETGGFRKDLPPAQQPEVKAAQTAATEGAKLETKKKANQAKAQRAKDSFVRQSNIAITELKRAGDIWTPGKGVGTALGGGFVPLSDMRSINNAIRTAKANIGFQSLQEMRANSPTGGALGQVAVQELENLEATLGAIDPGAADFPQRLDDIVKRLEQIQATSIDAYNTDYGKPQGATIKWSEM